MTTTAYIALGSNLGDRLALIRSAVVSLDQSECLSLARCSGIYETPPVGVPGQGSYLNAVVEVQVTCPPRGVLDILLAIEEDHGRQRSRELRWGPRRLDLDVLLHGAQVVDEEGLQVPHPRMHERRFVMVPLAELAPDLVHPILGCTMRACVESLSADPGEAFHRLDAGLEPAGGYANVSAGPSVSP